MELTKDEILTSFFEHVQKLIEFSMSIEDLGKLGVS